MDVHRRDGGNSYYLHSDILTSLTMLQKSPEDLKSLAVLLYILYSRAKVPNEFPGLSHPL